MVYLSHFFYAKTCKSDKWGVGLNYWYFWIYWEYYLLFRCMKKFLLILFTILLSSCNFEIKENTNPITENPNKQTWDTIWFEWNHTSEESFIDYSQNRWYKIKIKDWYLKNLYFIEQWEEFFVNQVDWTLEFLDFVGNYMVYEIWSTHWWWIQIYDITSKSNISYENFPVPGFWLFWAELSWNKEYIYSCWSEHHPIGFLNLKNLDYVDFSKNLNIDTNGFYDCLMKNDKISFSTLENNSNFNFYEYDIKDNNLIKRNTIELYDERLEFEDRLSKTNNFEWYIIKKYYSLINEKRFQEAYELKNNNVSLTDFIKLYEDMKSVNLLISKDREWIHTNIVSILTNENERNYYKVQMKLEDKNIHTISSEELE